jgi:monovalent cation:H+ antiporter, CPA1 family
MSELPSEILIVIAISFLILVANIILFLAKKTQLPFAVMLLLTGAIFYTFKEKLPFLELLEISNKPEILFFIFLPPLLFESAFNIDFRRLKKDLGLITALAVLGILLSSFVVGILSSYFLNIPIAVALLFGAIISSTDPIAVISIFKELGVPKRLIQLVDGESMLNDGTSLILSKLIVSFLLAGFSSSSIFGAFTQGVQEFFYVTIVSLTLGIVTGFGITKLISKIHNDFLIEISITIAVTYLIFILTEEVGGSAIISTVIYAMILGNYGKSYFSHQVKHLLSEIWEYLSFISNSLIFLLVGISFGVGFLLNAWDQILISYLIVTLARAISVYGIIWLQNLFLKEDKIPMSWTHVIWWGGMRGALPIAVAAFLVSQNTELLPELASYEEIIVTNIIGVVFISLILNGLTIRPLIGFLKINKMNTQQKIESLLMKALVLNKSIQRIKHLEKIGEISGKHRVLNKRFINEFRSVSNHLSKEIQENPLSSRRALYTYTFRIEREVFNNLQEKKLISSKILNILEEKLIFGMDLIQKNIFPEDFKDIIQMKKMSDKYKKKMTLQEFYIFRKAREFANLDVLDQLSFFENIPSIKEFALEISNSYRKLYLKNKKICRSLEENHPKEITKFERDMCYMEFIATEEDVLAELSLKRKISRFVLKDLQASLSIQ